MVEGYERSAIPLRLHNVLLALAGRLDDSALGQARRLAARARTDEAAELIIGSLVAGRIPVRAAEQRELAALLTAAGADDWVAEQLIIDEHHEVVQHRFSDGGGTAGAGVAEALQIVLQRLPDVRGVHAVWRNTVAGSVPGPMPQRLVLAEVGPAGSALATAYRMDTALRRAGIAAAVEVTDTGAARDGYHGMALAAADLVVSGPAEVADTYPPVYPEETPSPEPAPERYEPEPEPEPEPAPEPAPEAVEPEPVREPEPEPDPEPPTQPEPVLPEQYSVRPWTTGLPPINVVEQTGGSELEPGELFWPQSEPSAGGSAQPAPAARPEVPEETRAEQTTELTPSELGLLRSAIAAGKP
ncbi:MAG: hypothetical protein ACRDQB_02750, partial [Thermocrispum sp.]